MEEANRITLEDVEAMIKILERFVHLSQRAQKVLRRLAPSGTVRQADFMQMFMQMALEQKMGGLAGGLEEVSEEELDEDTKRVIEKIRAKAKQEANP